MIDKQNLFRKFTDHWKILHFEYDGNIEHHICGIVELYSFDNTKDHLEFKLFDPRYLAPGNDNESLLVKIDTKYFLNNDIHFDNLDCIILCNFAITRNGRHTIIIPTEYSSIIRHPFGSYKLKPSLLIQYHNPLNVKSLDYETELWPIIRELKSYRRKLIKTEPEQNRFSLIRELRADTCFASFDILCEVLEDNYYPPHLVNGEEHVKQGLRILKVCDFSGHNSLIIDLNDEMGQYTLPIEESILKIEVKGYDLPFSYSADSKGSRYLLIKGVTIVLENYNEKIIKGTIHYTDITKSFITFLPAAVDSIRFAQFTERRFKKMPVIPLIADMTPRTNKGQAIDVNDAGEVVKYATSSYDRNTTLADDSRFDWILSEGTKRIPIEDEETEASRLVDQEKFETEPSINRYINCPFRATPACKIGWILDHYYIQSEAFRGRSFRIIGKITNHIPQDYRDFIDRDTGTIRFLLIITGQDGRSIPVLFFGEDAANFLALTPENAANNLNLLGERMCYLIESEKEKNSLYIDLMIVGFQPESEEHRGLNIWKGFGSEINFIKI